MGGGGYQEILGETGGNQAPTQPRGTVLFMKSAKFVGAGTAERVCRWIREGVSRSLSLSWKT